ncbi:MAG: hypothetical protein VYE73_03665 [Acidobacteriota bacterium]|nr:hypothetical protein [Acidobacteriota bacterium]
MRHSLPTAEAHHRRGETAEALRMVEVELRERPTHLAAQVARCRYLLRLERAMEALEQAEAVLGRDPSQLVAQKLAVRAAVALGDRRAAQCHLARYGALDTADPELESLRREVSAIPSGGAQRSVARRARVSVTLGELYLEQGHRREAAVIFEDLLASDPDDERARRGLALASSRAGLLGVPDPAKPAVNDAI